MRVITVQKPSTASAAVRNVSQRLESSADKRAVEIVQCEDSVKRTARYRDSPLENDELLAAIFQAVGKREHMFAAAVSKRWSSCYLSKDSEYSCNTSYRSVLATDSRLQYALSAGLTVEHLQNWCKTLERDVCSSLEPIAVLQLLRARGLKWTSELCVEAVCSNDLELLQWLYTAGCLWPERRLVVTAAKHAGTALLDWLLVVTAADLWSGRPLRRLVDHAAAAGNVAAVQCFCLHGAQWPPSYARVVHGSKVCWSPAAVQYALNCGAGWREWRCQALSVDSFGSELMQRNAKELFAWAHSEAHSDCPCTCAQ